MLIKALIIYAACQAIFIALILLRPQNKTTFNRAFALLLIVEGLILIERLMVETGAISAVPHLLGIAYPISFLKPPLMLAMAYSITENEFKLSKKAYLHLIPFVLILALNTPFYFLSGADKLEFVNAFMNKVPSYDSFEFYFVLSFFIYIGIYVFLAIRKLDRVRAHVTNNALVNWLYFVLVAYVILLSVHLIYYLIQPLFELSLGPVNELSMLAMALIIQSVAFKLMDKSMLLNARKPDIISSDVAGKMELLIEEKFKIDKVHLDDSLTLRSFAEMVSLSPQDVTRFVNQKYGYNFKKLVNRYRLDEAKQLMRRMQNGDQRLIDIAYQSGFNNKVTFYRVFKELEGISPSAYLQNMKKKEN